MSLPNCSHRFPSSLLEQDGRPSFLARAPGLARLGSCALLLLGSSAASAQTQVTFDRWIESTDIQFRPGPTAGLYFVDVAARAANGSATQLDLSMDAVVSVNGNTVSCDYLALDAPDPDEDGCWYQVQLPGQPCGGTCTSSQGAGCVDFALPQYGHSVIGCACMMIVKGGGQVPHQLSAGDVVRIDIIEAAGTPIEQYTANDYIEVTFDPSNLPVPYCTAGTSANGCQAVMSSSGIASATATSGFSLLATGVEGQKDGLFFYGGNGRQANSWGNGTSFQCVVPPVIRAGLQVATGSIGQCDGLFSQDMAALWTAVPAKQPSAGQVVQAQLWYRDPANTSNQSTSLSNALEFTMLP